MLFIIASTAYQSMLSSWISEYKDLQQEVRLLEENTPMPSWGFYLKISNDKIFFPIDWYNTMPPLQYPTLCFEKNIFLGILYTKIGDWEKALIYFKDEKYLSCIAETWYALQQGLTMNESWIKEHLLCEQNSLYYHNAAVAFHYGTEATMEAQNYYQQAMVLSADAESKAFTAKHYALLLVDRGEIEKAQHIIEQVLQEVQSADAIVEMKALLMSIGIKQNRVEDVEKIRTAIQEIYAHYQSTGQAIRLGLLLMEASYLADNNNQFSEALQEVEKAMTIFKTERQDDLYINACMRKGTLLLAWAKSGQPQFYRSALQAFQDVLQQIDREESPHIFAEVHHHLGVIYAEIPDEIKKKSLWAGVSVSSFNEALHFFDKENYPYQYALICNNLGNAYTKYPVAVLSNNFDRALEWYNEALSIRTAEEYPEERVRTLLNYLEASWYATNEKDELQKLQQLKHIAQEILTLTADQEIIASVEEHLLRLHEAELFFNKKQL